MSFEMAKTYAGYFVHFIHIDDFFFLSLSGKETLDVTREQQL